MVQPIKIYVGNVPQTARNSELKELFEKFGKVVECDILKEFAFVHMDDTNGAKAAIAGLNDSLWKGSRIRVELSTTKTSKGEPSHRYRNHEDTSIDRLRRRSSDRERDRDRRNYSSFSSSSSRANDTYSYKDERSLPYDRYGPIPHRLAKSDLGPIRESRYGSSSSSRGYLPERGRPYPDAYDRGLDDRSYPPIRSGAPRMYSGNYSSYASGPYRSGSPHDYSRELRDSRGLEYSDPYMRPPPIGHYPPHGSYYRGPPIPPAGSSRYDYDHPSYGMPASSSRGSRYTPPSSYPVSSSSSSRHNYRSQNGTSPTNHSRDRGQNYLNDYSYSSNGNRHGHDNGGSSTSKRRHQSSSPRPDYHSSSIQSAKGLSSHNGKSKEDSKTKISSRSSSSNVNSRSNGKKSNINRSDTPISSSPSSSNSSSPSYNSIKHETTNSSQSNRSSRRRKIDQEAKKEKSASTSPANLNLSLKKKSSSRHRSRSTSTKSRSRSSKRSARY